MSPLKYNFIDEQLLVEKLKSIEVMKVSQELLKLTDLKPTLLKAFYKEAYNSYLMQCETEKTCKEQHDIKKMDTRVQKILEVRTNKKRSLKR